MMRVVAIRSGGETFALPVDAVGAVLRVEQVTRVPLAGGDFVGLYNMRGKILPLIDLRRRLDPAAPPTALPTLAVCIDAEAESYAVAVDEVGDVHLLPPDRQIEIPAHVEAARAALTRALFRLPEGLLPVLDVVRLFEPTARLAVFPLPET